MVKIVKIEFGHKPQSTNSLLKTLGFLSKNIMWESFQMIFLLGELFVVKMIESGGGRGGAINQCIQWLLAIWHTLVFWDSIYGEGVGRRGLKYLKKRISFMEGPQGQWSHWSCLSSSKLALIAEVPWTKRPCHFHLRNIWFPCLGLVHLLTLT